MFRAFHWLCFNFDLLATKLPLYTAWPRTHVVCFISLLILDRPRLVHHYWLADAQSSDTFILKQHHLNLGNSADSTVSAEFFDITVPRLLASDTEPDSVERGLESFSLLYSTRNPWIFNRLLVSNAVREKFCSCINVSGPTELTLSICLLQLP